MPAQQGGRCEQQAGGRDSTTEGGEDGAVGWDQRRSLNLAAENGKLVAENDQLEIAVGTGSADESDHAGEELEQAVDRSKQHGA